MHGAEINKFFPDCSQIITIVKKIEKNSIRVLMVRIVILSMTAKGAVQYQFYVESLPVWPTQPRRLAGKDPMPVNLTSVA